MRRAILVLACLAFTQAACFGSFAATRSLWQFNKGVSANKWLQELAFLGLSIIPVYEIFVLGDVIIFNSIEFWGGSNPVSADGSQPAERKVMLADGSSASLVRESESTMRIETAEGTFRVEKSATGMRVLAEDGSVVSEVREAEGGAVEVIDGTGEISRVSAAELASVPAEPGAITAWAMARAH